MTLDFNLELFPQHLLLYQLAYFGFLAKYLAIVSTVGHLVVVFDAACGRYLIQLTNSGALSDDVV